MRTKRHNWPTPRLQHSETQSGPTSHYDVETAVLMRCALRPLIERAESWADLMDALNSRGYKLVFRDGNLCLTRSGDNGWVCGLHFLGFEMQELVVRMGRPVVLVHPGSKSDGDLLRALPQRTTLH